MEKEKEKEERKEALLQSFSKYQVLAITAWSRIRPLSRFRYEPYYNT
jgi:hypothetical protein